MNLVPHPASGKPCLPPAHIGVIMDGNRRWARKRMLPTALGHAAGARRVREIVAQCVELGVGHLSLFAFSTENWRRPPEEVGALMGLFSDMLQREVRGLQEAGVRLRVLGNRQGFNESLQQLIADAEASTAQGDRLTLHVCANYGGRWDVLQAVQAWQAVHPGSSLAELSEAALEPFLATHPAPPVDLLIRTGGEQRISNFMLWQAAYAEMYFTAVLWPEFKASHLVKAVDSFKARDRRFGSSANFSSG